MFVLADLLSALAEVLDWVIQFLELAVLVRVILSWANADPYNGFVRMVGAVTEPLLRPFRKVLPPWRLNGLDLSPVFALLALFFIRMFLVRVLLDLSQHLR